MAVKLHSMQGTSLGIPRVNALRFGDATAVMSTCVVARPVAFSSLITAQTKRIRLRILKLACYGCYSRVPDGVSSTWTHDEDVSASGLRVDPNLSINSFSLI